jgi:hypothetical protein
MKGSAAIRALDAERKLVDKLNAELFAETEGPQSDAWVSDEANARSLHQFFEFVDSHLFYSREASRVISGFLRKHRKLRRRAAAQAEASRLPGEDLA